MSVSHDEPIAHLAGAYVGPADDYVVVAEVTDDSVKGFRGMRQLYTALILIPEIDEVLRAPVLGTQGLQSGHPAQINGLELELPPGADLLQLRETRRAAGRRAHA